MLCSLKWIPLERRHLQMRHTLISSLATSSRLTVAVSGKAAIAEDDEGVGVRIRVISMTGVIGEGDAEDEDPEDPLFVFVRRLVIFVAITVLVVVVLLFTGDDLLSTLVHFALHKQNVSRTCDHFDLRTEHQRSVAEQIESQFNFVRDSPVPGYIELGGWCFCSWCCVARYSRRRLLAFYYYLGKNLKINPFIYKIALWNGWERY